MQSSETPSEWMNISEAAAYLGVHFTTLRRWANAGQIDHTRTPGGKRRFQRAALDAFLKSAQTREALPDAPVEIQVMHQALERARGISQARPAWLARLAPEQRAFLRLTGNHLLALLMQFSLRDGENLIFLEEGRKIGRKYGEICAQVGMDVVECVQVFLLFRRPILDAVLTTGALNGLEGPQDQSIYQKSLAFMDDVLVATVEQHQLTRLSTN